MSGSLPKSTFEWSLSPTTTWKQHDRRRPIFRTSVVVSDADQTIAKAMDVMHKGAGRDGSDTNAPTTFLIDGQGKVQWLFRPDRFIERLSADELLKSIERVRG